MPRNVELKACLRDPGAALERARALDAPPPETEWQRDTYFRAGRRLKLRERRRVAGDGARSPLPTELIAYDRPDETGARASDYAIARLPFDTDLGDALALAVGIDAVVEKTRTVFLHEGVRIHLDEVEGLGSFLELEAIVDDACDDEAARRKVARLVEHFGLEPRQMIAGSYRELAASR